MARTRSRKKVVKKTTPVEVQETSSPVLETVDVTKADLEGLARRASSTEINTAENLMNDKMDSKDSDDENVAKKPKRDEKTEVKKRKPRQKKDKGDTPEKESSRAAANTEYVPAVRKFYEREAFVGKKIPRSIVKRRSALKVSGEFLSTMMKNALAEDVDTKASADIEKMRQECLDEIHQVMFRCGTATNYKKVCANRMSYIGEMMRMFQILAGIKAPTNARELRMEDYDAYGGKDGLAFFEAMYGKGDVSSEDIVLSDVKLGRIFRQLVVYWSRLSTEIVKSNADRLWPDVFAKDVGLERSARLSTETENTRNEIEFGSLRPTVRSDDGSDTEVEVEDPETTTTEDAVDAT